MPWEMDSFGMSKVTQSSSLLQVQDVGSRMGDGVRSMAMNIFASTTSMGQSAVKGVANGATEVCPFPTGMNPFHCSNIPILTECVDMFLLLLETM